MPPSARTLTLLVPGLLDAAARARPPAAPALARLLARADDAPETTGAQAEHAVFAAFGVELAPGATPPVAPVTRLLDSGEHDPGCWMRADPVHLAADRDRLLLADTASLQLGSAEARRLVADLVSALPELGGRLSAPLADRWYLRVDSCPDMRTWPPHAAGTDAGGFLPTGRDAARWNALLNEVQMVLHGSAVNAERERAGRPAANSLWFWGAGCLPRLGAVPWSAVWSNDPLAAGLARLAGVPAQPLPPAAPHWLERAGSGEHLVVIGGAGRTASLAGEPGWRALLQAFERHWARPLVDAVADGAVDQLRLRPLNGRHYRLDRRTLRRFWRRPRGLAPHLAPPAPAGAPRPAEEGGR